MSKPASAKASVEQLAPTKPPILTPGVVDIYVLRDWEAACRTYFEHKDVDEDDQVRRVASSLRDPLVRTWYNTDKEVLDALSFEDFFLELKTTLLESGWELKEKNRMLRLPQGNLSFYEWAQEVRNINAVLSGTVYYLNSDAMKSQLEARMSLHLQQSIEARALPEPNLPPVVAVQPAPPSNASPDAILATNAAAAAATARRLEAQAGQRLRFWLTQVKIREEENKRVEAVAAAAAMEVLRADRAQRKAARTPNQPIHTPLPRSSSSTNRTPSNRLPKLTDHERELLKKHDGCFKCRQFNVGHTVSGCPNGFPDPQGYKPLSAPSVIKQEAPVKKEPVAADSNPPPSNILEGSDSDDSEYVKPSPTALVHPFLFIEGPNSTTPLVRVRPLIDSGATAVLISPELADKLKLRRRKLATPRQSVLAIQTGGQPVIQTEWVKLRVMTKDQSWVSRTIQARIAPGVCNDLILGTPFIYKNYLVIDLRARTLIDKRTGYDLLNPPRRASPQQRPSSAKTRLQHILDNPKPTPALETVAAALPLELMAAVKDRIETLTLQAELTERDAEMRKKFMDRFPADIPHVDHLPTDVYHRIKLKDINKVITAWSYSCPKKYREAWRTLLDQHLEAGRIRPSSSPYSSPAFLIPKADPTALPRWVNDYRVLNENTVRDMGPLPRIEEILADVGRGKIFGKIDMTNSFFQTRVHPDDIPFTAVNTPFGLYEWTVMPMGGTNAPATHQRRMTQALKHLIGRICHVYLDDIIIWSDTVEEHSQNVEAVMKALREAHLYCSPKKTNLFSNETIFLGHLITSDGIKADPSKVERITNWPRPRTTTNVRAFLGIVRYIANYLPELAEHTSILTPLTQKVYDQSFPEWRPEHETAFKKIKEIVLGNRCLTTINYDSGDTIFVTTDASDRRTGAVLSTGLSWETARPVAFESQQLNDAEKNYPTHEKELLAIVRALKKWRFHLLGTHFEVRTDHRTLEYFQTQKDLSRRQARWSEFLSQYDFDIQYVKGEDNTVADGMSRYPDDIPDVLAAVMGLSRSREQPGVSGMEVVAATFSIALDPEVLQGIKEGYKVDEYCIKLRSNIQSIEGARLDTDSGLLYLGQRLVIPRDPKLRESLYRLAHDSLGHFGFDKSYAALRESYYWPNMRADLENAYISSCAECQRNKSSTSKPVGPLHPLPIPDKRFDSVAMDFIGPLPDDHGFNSILTITDRLGTADLRIIPTRTNITAEELAELFFDHWYCENGLPLEIICDRDRLFMSRFWEALHKQSGVKVKMSTAYHPETDGASERTNKTINQALRYHVDRHQKNWVRALPRVRFTIMNTINTSTGYTPFQLKSAHSPRLIPPITTERGGSDSQDVVKAKEVIEQLYKDVSDAQDNLLAAKTRQAHFANAHRAPEDVYQIGDLVMLSTKNRRAEYKAHGKNAERRAAKFFPRYDGPYKEIKAFPEKSEYTLLLPNSGKTFPGFHASLLKRHHPNDPKLFPDRELPRPGPVITAEGAQEPEWEVEAIIEERKRGKGKQYLVRYKGWGPEEDRWLPGRDLQENEALDRWESRQMGA